MHQNLSQKYRPQNFRDVVGQSAIVTTLQNAIALKKIAPAYLFCGCRGTGKTTLARLFAKALNCKAITNENEPCNRCSSCINIMEGKAFDIIEIDGASHRGVDDIRQINETICYATTSDAYKIYIIDEAHMLTKEAFNALLKTLEEPPDHVKFFLATTEPQKILPTIMSRCQRFDLQRLTVEQITDKLKKIATDFNMEVEKEVFELIGILAEGGLRDAESLLDQSMCYHPEGILTYHAVADMLGISPIAWYFRLDEAVHTFNLSFAFELSKEIFSSGKDLALFFEGLLQHYRTILLIHLHLHSQDQQQYKRSAQIYTQEDCLYILDYLIQWHGEILKTAFQRITLEMILLHVIRSKKRISIATLIQRFETLEGNETPLQKEVEITTSQPLPTPLPKVSPQELEVDSPLPFTKPKESFYESQNHHKIRLNTIMRFAAVELEGTIKKD